MSERNSTPSPISASRLHDGDDEQDLTDDLTDDLDLGFDGAEDLLRAWRQGMRPDPDLTVSEWADQHRKLSSRASAEPGQYRTARTPYLREIMDALSPGHPAQRISFMKAAQVGATEAGNNWIGFVIHHAPGPMLAVLPTVEMAKRSSRGRLDPLIAESPALRQRVNPARSRDAGNSMLSKEFPGGILVLTGANSATGLRSMPARYVFMDEVDAYPASADEEMLRAARNTLLGETWVESGDAPEWQRLADRRESFGAQIPASGLFLTAGADVQKDRIEVDVWAWGRGLESWLVDHIVIPGGPDDPACWDRLTDLLGRTWAHANGAVMPIARLAIDTGYEAAAVYAWARRQGFEQVSPVKGLEGFNRAAPVSGPTFVDATIGGKRLRRGARLWSVATATFKTETYRFLRLERPSDEDRALGVVDAPGTVHLPEWIDTEWLKQLVAEQLVTLRDKRGYARQEWQKMRERNEALDCRVYARAAAWILGADRWDEATWRRLEAQAGVETRPMPVLTATPEPTVPAAPKAGAPTTPRRKRRAYTPNFMRD